MVLDSWAVIALLRAEPGGPEIARRVAGGQAVISWINVGEVFCVVARRLGEAAARGAVDSLTETVRAVDVDADLVLDAARVKARHPLSYADAFAVALAERLRMPLLTGDPEILALDRAVQVVDPRSA
ncbi:MAG: type II toxin-antitoxin system VapC family toxin [Actinomycetota bacterium]|nr:type II toxin-antitoxin system VapC family toxin [Actinomycetota bacterium]